MIDTVFNSNGELILMSSTLKSTLLEWLALIVCIIMLIVVAYIMGLNKGKKEDDGE